VFRPMGTLLAQIWNTTDSTVRVVGYKGGVAGPPREPPSYLGPSRAPARSLSLGSLAGWQPPISASERAQRERARFSLYVVLVLSLGPLRLAAMVFCVRSQCDGERLSFSMANMQYLFSGYLHRYNMALGKIVRHISNFYSVFFAELEI
jgi:hypothetical protein